MVFFGRREINITIKYFMHFNISSHQKYNFAVQFRRHGKQQEEFEESNVLNCQNISVSFESAGTLAIYKNKLGLS